MFLVETGENRTPRPKKRAHESATGLADILISFGRPLSAKSGQTSRYLLSNPHRCQGCRTSTLRRRSEAHRGEASGNVAAYLGR